jgi:hypothetical protein
MIPYGAETTSQLNERSVHNFRLSPDLVERTPDMVGTSEAQSQYGLDVIGSNGEIYHVKPSQLAYMMFDKDGNARKSDTSDTGDLYPKATDEISKDFGFTDKDIADDATLAVFGEVDYATEVFGDHGDTIKAKHYTKDELRDLATLGTAVLVAENPTNSFVKEARLLAEQNGIPVAFWSIARDKFNQ